MSELAILSADEVHEVLTREQAMNAVTRALERGLEPSADLERTAVALPEGQLLLMPSVTGSAVGLKAITVAFDNPSRGLPRIQGAYLLFGSERKELRAILDGVALTNLRTPAVSMAAVCQVLSRITGPLSVVAFGAGPQAVGHVQALETLDLVNLAEVTYVVRHPRRAVDLLATGARVVAAEDPVVNALVGTANLVVCASSARKPLFDSARLSADAVVIAVGSHEPQARELDGPLMGRADVIVEDVHTALREAGDVVMAMREGHLLAEELLPLADVVRGHRTPRADRPVVFKSVGMAWQDLVVAEAVMEGYLLSRSRQAPNRPGRLDHGGEPGKPNATRAKPSQPQ